MDRKVRNKSTRTRNTRGKIEDRMHGIRQQKQGIKEEKIRKSWK